MSETKKENLRVDTELNESLRQQFQSLKQQSEAVEIEKKELEEKEKRLKLAAEEFLANLLNEGKPKLEEVEVQEKKLYYITVSFPEFIKIHHTNYCYNGIILSSTCIPSSISMRYGQTKGKSLEIHPFVIDIGRNLLNTIHMTIDYKMLKITKTKVFSTEEILHLFEDELLTKVERNSARSGGIKKSKYSEEDFISETKKYVPQNVAKKIFRHKEEGYFQVQDGDWTYRCNFSKRSTNQKFNFNEAENELNDRLYIYYNSPLTIYSWSINRINTVIDGCVWSGCIELCEETKLNYDDFLKAFKELPKT